MTDSGQVPLTPRWNYLRHVELQRRVDELEQRLQALEGRFVNFSDDAWKKDLDGFPEMTDDYVDNAVDALASLEGAEITVGAGGGGEVTNEIECWGGGGKKNVPLTKEGRPDQRYKAAKP